jgi:hypothetical protein
MEGARSTSSSMPSRSGYDTAENRITNNTVTLRGSATITAGVTCYNVTDCLPYSTSKANLFQGNTYRAPSWTGENRACRGRLTGSHGGRSASTRPATSSCRDGRHVDHRRHGVIGRRACRALLLVEVGRRSASAMRVLARSI